MISTKFILFFLCTLSLFNLQSFCFSSVGINFYKTKDSQFPSGQENVHVLKKNFVNKQFEISYLVEKSQRNFWINSNSIIRDIELSQFVTRINSEEKLKILQIRGYWALTENVKKRQEWIAIMDLVSYPNDFGVAITLFKTPLKITFINSKPNKLDATFIVPQRERLEIQSLVDDNKLEVVYKNNKGENLLGFVYLDSVLLKIDFSSFVLSDSNTWKPFRYRKGNNVFVGYDKSNLEKIPLEKVSQFMTRPDLGVSSVENDLLKIRTPVIVKNQRTFFWNESLLKGHGKVFWKNPEQKGNTTEEILKMDIFSAHFDPLKKKGIISSQGVFITNEGQFWKEIVEFKGKNYPVSLSPEGHFIVGHWFSRDGQNFEPYLNLAQITSTIQKIKKEIPEQIHIKEISWGNEPQHPIILTLNTGRKLIKIKQDPKKTKWEIME